MSKLSIATEAFSENDKNGEAIPGENTAEARSGQHLFLAVPVFHIAFIALNS